MRVKWENGVVGMQSVNAAQLGPATAEQEEAFMQSKAGRSAVPVDTIVTLINGQTGVITAGQPGSGGRSVVG